METRRDLLLLLPPTRRQKSRSERGHRDQAGQRKRRATGRGNRSKQPRTTPEGSIWKTYATLMVAIAIDPEYADAHYNLGVLLDHKEDYAAPPSPPGGTEARRHQPILGLDTAPRPLRLIVCACLDRPCSLLPAEPRVRPLPVRVPQASGCAVTSWKRPLSPACPLPRAPPSLSATQDPPEVARGGGEKKKRKTHAVTY